MTKSIKKPLSLLLTLALVFSLASGLASPVRAATSHVQITISDDGPITAAIVSAALSSAGVTLSSDTYDITFTGSPTSIDNDAFKNCTGLVSIAIPTTVTAIGDSAFEGCTGLTGVDISGTVASIGDRAFYGCTGLANVYIRLGVETIGNSAFSGCTGLTSVTFPVSVETVGTSAFANCYGLTDVVFAGNGDPTYASDLTSIGELAFSACRWLSAVEFLGSVPAFGSSVFASCALNLTLYYPTGTEANWSGYTGSETRADIAVKPADGECLITRFEVNGVLGAIDNVSNIIFAIVPDGTALTALTPVIQHDGDTISPVTAQNFNTPRVYEVSDNSGTVRRYAVYVMETGSVDVRVNSATPIGSYVSTGTDKLVISFYVANTNYVAKYDVTSDNGATLSNPVWSGTGNNRTLTYDLSGLSANTTYNVLVRALYGQTGNEFVRPYANAYSFSTYSDPGGTPSTVTCTVTYDANGGTGSYKVPGLTSGVTHTVLTLDGTGISREGYSFTGWNTKADGSGDAYAPGDGLAISGNVTLYAQWSAPKLDTENHFAYIVGYPDGSVKPESNITRAETATIFFRLLTQEYRAEVWSTSNSFSDVSSSVWYNNAVSTLSNAGVLNGYSDGSFAPDSSITRAEFAFIAVRFADTSGISADGYSGSFTDIAGHWAEEDIKLAAQLGYINGYEDGTFRPDDYITRAEVMTLLNRVLGRHVDSDDDMLADMVTWPDNTPGKWFYFDVQEATNSHYYENPDDAYETWTELREAPDWSALEKPDSKPGDVSY